MERKIIWNKVAVKSLQNSLKWISKESFLQAENVEQSILLKIESLKTQPDKFPLDKFKVKNDGSFRAFEDKDHRISYRVLKDSIRILRVRHVRQRPKPY